MNLDFVVIDVETANFDRGSICQIGVVEYVNGSFAREWVTLVNPETHFDWSNIAVHGIQPRDVVGAPTFCEVYAQLHEWLANKVVISHTAFDKGAIKLASEKAGIENPKCTWLDSACVARRAWAKHEVCGYGLTPLCELLAFDFKHHDALEDAKAAAHIFMHAVERTGLDVSGWLKRVKQPVSARSLKSEA